MSTPSEERLAARLLGIRILAPHTRLNTKPEVAHLLVPGGQGAVSYPLGAMTVAEVQEREKVSNV